MTDDISNGEVRSQIAINDKVKAMLWHIAEALFVAAIMGIITVYGVSQRLSGQIEMMQEDIQMIKQSLMSGRVIQGEPGPAGKQGKTGKTGTFKLFK